MKESFNPQEKIEKLKFSAKKESADLVSGESRRTAYNEFINQRKEQKEGIVELSAEIIKILTKNPDTLISDIKEIIDKESLKYRLADFQKDKFIGALKEYKRRRKAVKKWEKLSKTRTPKKIFEKITGIIPKFEVGIEFFPITIHFKLDKEDYKAITREKEGKESLGTYFKRLEIVSIENKDKTSESFGNSIKLHEEGHAIKDLFEKTQFNPKEMSKVELEKSMWEISKIKDKKERDAKAIKFARELISSKEEKIKDEIFAQFRGLDRSTNEIYSLMKTGGSPNYDYFEDEKHTMLIWKIVNNEKIPQDLDIEPVFEEQYDKILKQSIESFDDYMYPIPTISKEGPSPLLVSHKEDEAMMFFMYTPLLSWPKEIRRLRELTDIEAEKNLRNN